MGRKETKILLIEDNPFDRKLIGDMLLPTEEESFALDYAENLADGLNQLDTNVFDLLLLDLNLPDSEGIDTLHTVTNHTPNIPIVVFSAIDNEEIALKTVKEGAQDYLFKGQVDEDLIFRSIHYAMERKKAQERLKRVQGELETISEKMKSKQKTDKEGPEHAIKEIFQEKIELESAHQALEVLTDYLLERTSALIRVNNQLKQEVETRKRTEFALRESEERFHKMAQVIPVVFWIYSPLEKKMLYVSPAFETMYQRPREEYYQNPSLWINVIHAEDIEYVKSTLEITQGTERELEYRIVLPGGTIRWIYDRIYPVRNEKGDVMHIVGFLEDITKQKEIEETLKRLSITDSLTCLYNQRHFYKKGVEEFERAERKFYPLSVMILDVDDFKNYNDTYGHLAGDTVLKEIAHIIKNSIKKTVDNAFRYGGDEFSVILPYATYKESVSISRRIREKTHHMLKGIGISIGIASRDDHDSFEDMVSTADKNMYADKYIHKRSAQTTGAD